LPNNSLVDNYTVKSITLAAKNNTPSLTGVASFDAAVTVLAKVQYKIMEVKSVNDGTRKISNLQIYVGPAVVVNNGDQAVVDGVEYIVEMINPRSMFEDLVEKMAILV
jgi:hypothetical protein